MLNDCKYRPKGDHYNGEMGVFIQGGKCGYAQPPGRKRCEPCRDDESRATDSTRLYRDDRGNIGKRYRRQDEIGTPFCVTYDFESETDGCVTVRFRDSMEQERVAIADLDAYFAEKLDF